MTDLDYLMSDIRDAVGMVVSCDKCIDSITDKVMVSISPEINSIQDELEQHEKTRHVTCSHDLPCRFNTSPK